MSLKDILVHMDDTPHCEKRMKLAIKLANQHGAKLFALFTRAGPNVLGISSHVEKCRKRHKKEGETAHKIYRKLAEKEGIDLNWHTAKFPGTDDLVTDQLVHYAQHMDMTIVGQYDHSTATGSVPSDLAERLVLETGRPTLIIPYAGEFKQIGKRVMIAWNTGRESVRAVNDAISLMQDAKKVHVVAINPRKGHKRHGDIPSADIADHLKRHGIEAEAEYMNTKELDPGNTLLSLAVDESIDLLVMGAYGHHRFRELVMGGVTREILDHMTLPVLMSH